MKMGLIGAGNMGRSMLQGWVSCNINPSSIFLAEINRDVQAILVRKWGIRGASIEQIAKHCDVIVLAVKPIFIIEVCQKIVQVLSTQTPVVLSIAAGVRLSTLSDHLGKTLPIVRVMPNIGAQVQHGMSVLCAQTNVKKPHRVLAEKLISAIGDCFWVEDENLMNIVTALSGSGPAYFLLMAEMMIKAGVKKGLSPDQAKHLVTQTLIGTAKLLEKGDSPRQLRAAVASKGGTTERAIGVFLSGGFDKLCDDAVSSAYDRSVEIEKQIT